jgi:hypothetical protein
MRTTELLRLARKTLKGRWAVLPAAGIAIAAFCLCFAGTAILGVHTEKSEPYEIEVSAGEGKSLTDANADAIAQIEDVTAATAVLKVPVILKAGTFQAPLTLTGLDSVYIEERFLYGGVYPPDSVMPYIVLNEAACRQFAVKEGDTASESARIDWLNESIAVEMGEGIKPGTARVCGILEEQEDAEIPMAYVSLASAKALLKQCGQAADYTAILARVTDIGSAEKVSGEIMALGLTVNNSTKELQAGWNRSLEQSAYLAATGAFGLLCAGVLLAAWRKISRLENCAAWETLKTLGMSARMQRRLFAAQAGITAVTGTAIGIAVSLALPYFLFAEASEIMFKLQPPALAVVISAALCMLTTLSAFALVRDTARMSGQRSVEQ